VASSRGCDMQMTVIGIPIALLMFDRTPFIASLYRY
jgi:hypothetical protein